MPPQKGEVSCLTDEEKIPIYCFFLSDEALKSPINLTRKRPIFSRFRGISGHENYMDW